MCEFSQYTVRELEIEDIIDTIHCGDCLEFMGQLPDRSIDFVFTDPPWNAGKDYGVWNDKLPMQEYLQFMSKVIGECNRLSKNGIALFVGSKIVRHIWNLVPAARCIVIRKGAISTPTPDMYYRQWCALLVTRTPLDRVYDIWDRLRMVGEGYFYKGDRFPHPGQTSIEIVNRVLRYFSKAGEIILDPFMGTATTAIACLEADRHYIGIELNDEYVEIGNKRIEAERAQLKLF